VIIERDINLTAEVLKRFKAGDNPKTIILCGIAYIHFEIGCDQRYFKHNQRFYSSIQELQLLTKHNSYILNHDLDTVMENILLLSDHVKVQENYLYHYKWLSNLEIPNNATVRQLLKHFEIDPNAWTKRVIMNIMINYGGSLDTEVTLVETKFNIEEVIGLFNNEFICVRNYILFKNNFSCYEIPIVGKGRKSIEESLMNNASWQFSITERNNDYENKFNVKTVGLLEDENTQPENLFVLASGLTPDNILQTVPVESTIDFIEYHRNVCVIEMYEAHNGSHSFEAIPVDEIPNAKVMDYWNFDTLMEPTIQLPGNKHFKFKSRLHPDAIKTSTKIRMEEYPIYARPSVTQAFFESVNAISSRQGSLVEYAIKKPNAEQEYEMFCQNYYHIDHLKVKAKYKNDMITITAEGIQSWTNKHNYPDKVKDELKKMIEEGWEKHPINQVTVHPKTEQTTKITKPPRWIDEVMSRNISAASYAISALFSKVFDTAKKRFKYLLHEKMLYADGLTPQQLNARLKYVTNVKQFVEDDLSMQDSQTTHDVLQIEYLVYKDLGIHPAVLDLYFYCHSKWSWHTDGTKGKWDAMRHSGECCTALGNAVVNLIVHNRLYERNASSIELYCFLGDDDLIFM